MDYAEWMVSRLTELRMQKGVSARDMSLSLGQSESYINKIENHRTLPSMAGFFYICDYLGITPGEFFNQNAAYPEKQSRLKQAIEQLDSKQIDHIMWIIDAIIGNQSK